MRNYLLVIITALKIITCNAQQQTGITWIEGFPQDFSKDNKITMVDFYDKGCPPCVRLMKETFTDKRVIEFIQSNLTCFKFYAWAKENKPTQEKYKVYGIPMLVFFDSKGNEIERLSGFIPPDKLLIELNRIKKGENTYLSLKEQYSKEPNNPEIVYHLAFKEANIGRKGDDNSQILWKKLSEVSVPDSYYSDYAKLNYYTGILWANKQSTDLVVFLDSLVNDSLKLIGFKDVLNFFRYDKKDTVSEIKYYKKYSDYIINNKTTLSPSVLIDFLNGYSWRMTEFNQNLNDALEKINYVVSILPDNTVALDLAGKLDTQSEVLWKLNRNVDALMIVDRCIKLLPDNDYLKEKRQKIIESKNNAR